MGMFKFGLIATALALAVVTPGLRADDTPPNPADSSPAEVVKTHIIKIKLSEQLQERPQSFQLSLSSFGPSKSPALSSLIITLNKAIKDPTVSGVYLNLQSFSLGMSQAQELGALIQGLKKAGKHVTVFTEDYETPTLLLASYADTVIMPENGNVLAPGVRMELMFWKGLLDKVHVQADMVQVGKYKGAEESFTRTSASPEFAAQIDGLINAFYSQLITTLSTNRNLDAATVTAAIDEGWLTGKRAKELKLVDELLNEQDVEKYLEKQAKGGADIVSDYGENKKAKVELDNPFAIFQLLGAEKKSTRTAQPAVAVVYADGEITGDSADETQDTGHVTPSLIRKAVKKAVEDDLVKAIVLRIDSPGGSASASDEIWQILKEADKKKPVTVSMGRLAASGGYYIACAGRSITAEPATITGSIGVVGGKMVLGGLFDWAGMNVQPFSKGKHADLFSETTTFSPEEREYITKLMTETYGLFTSRVKAGRGDKIKEIADVAQGRLFDGNAAVKAGLVDQVGTLNETVARAAADAKIGNNFQILVYPEAKTLADMIREGFQVDSKMPSELGVVFKALPREYQGEFLKMLNLTHTLQQEKLLLALPVGIVEK
jgi:protease IV